jgi:hypothetical protein
MLGFKRLFAALAVSSVIAWLGSAPALASNNPHDRQLQPLPGPFTQPMCGPAIGDVTVSIDPNSFRATTMTFTLENGTTKIEFTGFARQIVQGNGKTLELNVSGPGALFIPLDGAPVLVGEGHLFYIGPVGTPQQGLFMYTGLTTLGLIEVAPYGTIAVVTGFTGHKTDVCALLA